MSGELFNKRVRDIIDATSFREPDKIPVGFDYLNWPYRYCGKTLKQLIKDPLNNAREYCRFMDEVKFDFSMNLGFYDAYDMFDALGSKAYFLCEDECTVQHNQANSHFMEPEEYDILIDNPAYFFNEYYLKRNVPALKMPRDKAYQMLKNAAECAVRCTKTTEYICEIAMDEYDKVPLAMMGPPSQGKGSVDLKKDTVIRDPSMFSPGAPFYYSPLDTLFDTYRGMLGTFEDLMDRPDTLRAACDAIASYQAQMMPPIPEIKEKEPPLLMGFAVYHVAPYLSPELYDEFWFEGFKKVMLPYAKAGKKIYVKGESSFLHTIERFNEFPKGSLVIQLDADDPVEAHRIIGGQQSLATGLQTAMLQLKEEELIRDQIRRSFDLFAPGGGFLFYLDMPLMSPGDATTDRVIRTWDFIDECSKGHY